MIRSEVYPNPLDNPELIHELVESTSVEYDAFQFAMLADMLANRGYEVTVQEGRLNVPAMNIGEVKFAENPETGNTEGIDTSYGHRWTIAYDKDRDKYKLTDHKLGVTANTPDLLTAKGMAMRAAATEVDPGGQSAYGEEPGAKASYEQAEPLKIETLRSMFPGHYLNK